MQVLYPQSHTLSQIIHQRVPYCQLACYEKPPTRQLQTRINQNYIPVSRLSMDLKVKPKSYRGHKYILYIIDEVNNYLITVSVHKAKSEEVGEALIENVITKYCIPEYIIMDQESNMHVFCFDKLLTLSYICL